MITTIHTTADRALCEYLARMAEASALVDRIRAYVDEHMSVDPGTLHWGHVGNAGHLIEQLREIADPLAADSKRRALGQIVSNLYRVRERIASDTELWDDIAAALKAWNRDAADEAEVIAYAAEMAIDYLSQTVYAGGCETYRAEAEDMDRELSELRKALAIVDGTEVTE